MGDLAPGAKSTLVDVRNGAASIVRVGAIEEDRVRSALGA